MAFPREFILKARQANLAEFLQAKGYVLKREGKNWRLPGYGGLVIKGNGYYRFSTEEDGNALDFCIKFLNMSFRDAVLGLNGTAVADVPLQLFKEEKKELEMPARHKNERRVIAYLTKTRGLPAELVVELIRAGLLYQDEKGNCVFVCNDSAGRAQGAILAGTVSNVSWKGLAVGSDTTFGWWWLPSGTDISNTVTVIEAPIDAMSLAVIQPTSVRLGHVLALGGLHREALEGFVGRVDVKKVVLALDGDIWGRKAAAEWRDWLIQGYEVENLVPAEKDWNEVLKRN
ncbi:hypothetical protein DCCM_3758 [Desulfocucumis palustris]|uniref:DUF3991 domain-containing protein n=1 Tax=Desulfocucumis palustris TaxID=1898651 RepID=A0A2L2XEI1_9FIRM|nr:DUF3991 domain-containing protein [Desulfocucumis palustris]GBF34638.1 hypothetical protein DCCM_3758 [Desulfocucumis palustris]